MTLQTVTRLSRQRQYAGVDQGALANAAGTVHDTDSEGFVGFA